MEPGSVRKRKTNVTFVENVVHQIMSVEPDKNVVEGVALVNVMRTHVKSVIR